MITLLSDTFVLQPVTTADLQIATLTWGFTLGFGFLTVWSAIKQTMDVHRRYGYSKLNSPYIWMIWLEIVASTVMAVICWLHLNGYIPPSFAFYFVILTCWALQVQFLLQIIINRVSIILPDRKQALMLKFGVAIFITLINISVYCIWIPARLQISPEYEHINNIWDRVEKVIYLVVDAALNWYFIDIVKKRLVKQGLTKYNELVRFNMWIIVLSLAMDVLIISMMSLKNSFVYMQFHPLAYIVKLNIEMSMSDLIVKVAKTNAMARDKIKSQHSNSNPFVLPSRDLKSKLSSVTRDTKTGIITQATPAVPNSKPATRPRLTSFNSTSTSSDLDLDEISHGKYPRNPLQVNMTSEVSVHVERRGSEEDSAKNGSGRLSSLGEDDTRPLRKEESKRASRDGGTRSRGEKRMGVSTDVYV